MVADSWFRYLWKPAQKHEAGGKKLVIGVLTFEITSMMSKLVHLWQSLTDKQVARLRDKIANSAGIKKLVSEEDDYIVGLICSEMIENLEHVAKAVARLGKKCNEPSLQSFEHSFSDLVRIGADPYRWEFSSRKMDSKLKKMERFISASSNLYQEMEMLVELEQTLRRMKGNNGGDRNNLIQFEKKVVLKRHELMNMRTASLWNRSYSCTVLLLARSIFTIFRRINHVFGLQPMLNLGDYEDSGVINSGYIHNKHSVSTLLQSSSGKSSGNAIARFFSGPLGRFTAKSGSISKTSKNSYFSSGPLRGSNSKSGPISKRNKSVSFYSGPMRRSKAISARIFGTAKISRKMWQINDHLRNLRVNKLQPKPNRLIEAGPFKGSMMTGNSSTVANCYLNMNGVSSDIRDGVEDIDAKLIDDENRLSPKRSILTCRNRLLNAPPETLGASALALHYANVIIVIEKLAASPHLIGQDARDDLYNMLPAKVRTALRERLKPCRKNLDLSLYDSELAKEWSDAMAGILDWLAPLAHNMIRWQSERSYEQQNFLSRTNVLLVQTLYYANQEKIEATITELLIGLNYIWRFGREFNAKAFIEGSSSRIFDEYLELEG